MRAPSVFIRSTVSVLSDTHWWRQYVSTLGERFLIRRIDIHFLDAKIYGPSFTIPSTGTLKLTGGEELVESKLEEAAGFSRPNRLPSLIEGLKG